MRTKEKESDDIGKEKMRTEEKRREGIEKENGLEQKDGI